jgi:hypothetical protein
VTSPGTIENQQLLLDKYGLGHHDTRPARTREPGDGRQEVENQDGQVTHVAMLTSERNPRNAKGIRNAPYTGQSHTAADGPRERGLVEASESKIAERLIDV